MNTEVIEVAIEKYVQTRMGQGRQRAREYFMAYAYMKLRGEELGEFMKKVGGLCRYYISYLRAMENPLRGPEMWWLASMFLITVYSCYLMGRDDDQLIGVVIFSGTVVQMITLVKLVADKWRETGVMIAIYREIAEIAEDETVGTTRA